MAVTSENDERFACYPPSSAQVTAWQFAAELGHQIVSYIPLVR